jgi:hypothetical protein
MLIRGMELSLGRKKERKGRRREMNERKCMSERLGESGGKTRRSSNVRVLSVVLNNVEFASFS